MNITEIPTESAEPREPYVSHCVVCGKPGKEHPTGRWCLSDQLVTGEWPAGDTSSR